MRILFWSSSFWPNIGGVGVLAARFVPALCLRGYEFVVITPQGNSDESWESEYKGIPVYHCPFWKSMINIEQLTTVRQKIAKLIGKFKPDLIHVYALNRSNFFYHLIADQHPAPLLVTLHGLMAPEANALTARTLQKACWVAACSGALLKESRRLFPQIASKSSTIHNGLEEPQVQPTPLSFDPPRLVCLGRLVETKGFDIALAAFHTLLSQYPKAQLIIAGDGPAKNDLERQALTLGVREAVEFPGRIAPGKIADLLNTATVVIMPSRWEEPFGLVALEAALMARPIIATRVGGLPEIVRHQETGFLVEKENSGAICETIKYLLSHPKRAEQLGLQARLRAQKEFSWQSHIDAYDTLYRRMAGDL